MTIVMLIAAGVVALGSFLPWLTVTAPLVGSISRSGMDSGGDGVFTLILAVVVAAVAASGLKRRLHVAQGVVTLLAGLAAFGILLVDFVDIIRRINDLQASSEISVQASPGAGIILALVASLVVSVTAVVALANQGRRP